MGKARGKQRPPPSDQDLLRSWRALNGSLADCAEDQVERLLKLEQGGAKRRLVLRRLHQRLSKLRMRRERAELLGFNYNHDRQRARK